MAVKKTIKYLNSDRFHDLFVRFIKESSKGKRTQKNGKRIKPSTLDNYINTAKLLKDFELETKFEIRLYLAGHLKTKEQDQAKKYYRKFFNEFTDYLYFKKDFYDNYVGLIVKSLRTFFNYLNTELSLNVGEFHKKFYVPSEEIAIVVLSPEQLKYLIDDKELCEKLPSHLKTVKDIFVFGCTVALRISDLMQLKQENIQFYNGAHYLKVSSQKTGTNTTIKLPDYAVEILKKHHKKQKNLLPVYSRAYLNRSFKKLGSYLNYEEPQAKYRTKKGIKYEIFKNKIKRESFNLADHITTHTMRRTAITTMLRMGMPDQVVRKISGHTANSKEFFRYVEFAQSYVDEHTDKVFEKISQIEATKSVFL
jgi:integrase